MRCSRFVALSLFLFFLASASVLDFARAQDNVAIRFAALNDEFLATPLSGGANLGPNRATGIGQSRAMFTLASCMYDAWAAYDSRALPSTYHSGAITEIPRVRGSSEDVEEAVAFAAYRAMAYLFAEVPENMASLNAFFADLGYDSTDTNTDLDNPAGVGNSVCNTVINERKEDGTNSEGDKQTAKSDEPYADYTNYNPVNPEPALDGSIDCSEIDINHWVPLRITNTTVQEMNEPYAALIKPFALDSPFEFEVPGPPLRGTPRDADFVNQFTALVGVSSGLTDREKVEADYWASASGGLLFQRYTYQAARNRGLSLGDTIKLLFAQSVAVWDGAITCWAYKRLFDSARPISVIPCLFDGQNITAWRGPYLGTGTFPASEFRTYVDTPPFTEYPSGHSTFSGGSAYVLRSFFGTDEFHADPITFAAGASTVEGEISDPGNPKYMAGLTDVPNTGPGTPGYVPAANVTLVYATWTAASDAAGVSRVYGGFHTQSGNEDALVLGEKVGEKVWAVCSSLFDPQGSAASHLVSTFVDAARLFVL